MQYSSSSNAIATCTTLILLLNSVNVEAAAVTCTGKDQDPYATGSLVNCCTGLTKILGNFNSQTKENYQCQDSTSSGSSGSSGSSSGGTSPTDLTKATLQWSDEFDSFDTSVWEAVTGYLNVNGEIETYSSDKQYAYAEGGVMNLVAKKQSDGKWYSARYQTKGTKEFLYGYIETKIKMPVTNGAFPAVWMLGGDGGAWPARGEIDIAEYQSVWSKVPTTLHFTDHHGGNALSYKGTIDNLAEWHTFGWDWREDYLAAYQDGVKIGEYKKPANADNSNWPYGSTSNPFYFLMNLAVQPSWGSHPDAGTTEMKFQIDYIRVYE